jgi:sulfur-oxidizing protein SoxY
LQGEAGTSSFHRGRTLDQEILQLDCWRRDFVKKAGGGLGLLGVLLAAGMLRPEDAGAAAWNTSAFEGKKLDEVIRSLGGTGLQEGQDIALIAPEIAENGAVVPIQIVSSLPQTQAIAVAVEKNPRLLAAYFEIPKGTLADIQTRVKMAETCNVYALVKADGGFYYVAKEIKITAGGCGG